MSRKTPGTCTTRSWRNIFDNSIIIPMNQRSYEWEESHVNKFIDDAIDIFMNTNYNEVLGSIIMYNTADGKECYDGQQRIITTIVTSCAISHLCRLLGDTKHSEHIFTVIKEDVSLAPVITTRMTEFTDKYGPDMKMPKVHCVSPEDDEAMCMIYNGYQPQKKPASNRIYTAFSAACHNLQAREFTVLKLVEFFKFLMNNVEVHVYDTDDAYYACRLFEWTNNRGSPVKVPDINKNMLLSRVTDQAKVKVFDKWNEIKNSYNGEKILNCAIQVYNSCIKRVKVDSYECLVRATKAETYKEIKTFFGIADRLVELYAAIRNDRFGRLFFAFKNIQIATECIYWLLLPIFYARGSVDTKLLKLIVKFAVRNLKKGTRIFNKFSHSNMFIEVSNKYMFDRSFDYYGKVLETFQNEYDDDRMRYENYVSAWSDFKWTTPYKDAAKTILHFIETCSTPDGFFPNLDHDLEHVWPTSKRTALGNPLTADLLGNLTLLEGKKSDCGQKGNRSLQDTDFSSKKTDYAKSSCSLTRSLSELNVFDEACILKRNSELCMRLNDLTYFF